MDEKKCPDRLQNYECGKMPGKVCGRETILKIGNECILYPNLRRAKMQFDH